MNKVHKSSNLECVLLFPVVFSIFADEAYALILPLDPANNVQYRYFTDARRLLIKFI
jgi:hypothetical protein